MKVLVSGAGALLGQGILRALNGSSYKYQTIAADPNPLSAGLYWQNERFLLPMAKDPQFTPKLIELLKHTQPDVFIPGTDAELPVLAKNKALIERETKTKVLVSSGTVIEIADNKQATAEFFKNSGFTFPMTADQNDIATINDIVKTCGFPLIVKPKRGARSIGVVLVQNQSQLDRTLAQCNDCIVQEHLPDTAGEFTAGAIVFDGVCNAAIVMKRDLRDGNTYRATVVPDDNLIEIVQRWGELLNPMGPANFQFRMNRHNQPTVFEINARFSGTTPLRALVGFNEVEMVLQKMVNNSAVTQPIVQHRTILRHWSETVVSEKDVNSVSYV